MKRYVAALIVVGVIAAAPAAEGQCCGDCDGSGDVAISELIGAVNNALASCATALQPVIDLHRVALSALRAALRTPVAEGRIELELETEWAGDDPSDRILFGLMTPNTFSNRVELIKNGQFLRWIVTESSGREVDLSVRNVAWQPGMHAVAASWQGGRTELTIDGIPVLAREVGAVSIGAGADVFLGEPGASGTTFRDVSFTARAP